MTDERLYNEDEIAEIFETAATPADPRRRAASSRGLTLHELQAIGSEVGVPPDRIAEAAAALDVRHDEPARRTDFGLPIAVGRTVELPRALTESEWEVIIGELRRTFNAQGRDTSAGNLRAWSNGNLRAYVERDESGYRFRLSTLKSSAVAANRAGIVGLMIGSLGLIVAQPEFFMFGAMGAAAFGFNALRLPRWASERERQMEYIAARVQSLIRTGLDARELK